MYHACRSVVFFVHGGDDHEQHSVLPGKLPNDMPGHAYWQNELKSARGWRNEADYDPFPSGNPHFRTIANNLSSTAPQLLQVCRTYLQNKGCQHL
jgi:hypothetical protein